MPECMQGGGRRPPKPESKHVRIVRVPKWTAFVKEFEGFPTRIRYVSAWVLLGVGCDCHLVQEPVVSILFKRQLDAPGHARAVHVPCTNCTVVGDALPSAGSSLSMSGWSTRSSSTAYPSTGVWPWALCMTRPLPNPQGTMRWGVAGSPWELSVRTAFPSAALR